MVDSTNATICRTKEFTDQLVNALQVQRLHGENTDFTIVTGDSSFRCHRNVLAASSSVLKRIVSTGMAETARRKASFKKIPAQIMEILLDYMYTGTVMIHEHDLHDVITASGFFDMQMLKHDCERQVMRILNPTNVIYWFQLESSGTGEDLIEERTRLMRKSFATILSGDDYLELAFTKFREFVAEIRFLNVKSVLRGIERWVSHATEQRTKYLADLVQILDTTMLPPASLSGFLDNNDAAQDPEMRELLDHLRGLQLGCETGPIHKDKDTLVLIGELKLANGLSQYSCYITSEGERTSSFALEDYTPADGGRLSLCSIPHGFVLTGGPVCTMYDLITERWSFLRGPAGRHSHVSCYTKGRIYLFGGIKDKRPTQSVQFLEMEVDLWRFELADMPLAMVNPSVTHLNNVTYLLDAPNLLAYSTEQNTWREVGFFKRFYPDWKHALMTSDGRQLYITGGTKNLLVRYDVGPRRVHNCQTSEVDCHTCGTLVLVERKLYLICMHGAVRVHAYDAATMVWRKGKLEDVSDGVFFCERAVAV